MHSNALENYAAFEQQNYSSAFAYSIVQNITNFEGQELIMYGIKIKKLYGKIEEACVRDVTTSKTDIEELASRFQAAGVEPVHLRDCIEDYLIDLS